MLMIMVMSLFVMPLWDMFCPKEYEFYKNISVGPMRMLAIYGLVPPVLTMFVLVAFKLMVLFLAIVFAAIVFTMIYLFVIARKK